MVLLRVIWETSAVRCLPSLERELDCYVAPEEQKHTYEKNSALMSLFLKVMDGPGCDQFHVGTRIYSWTRGWCL